MKRFPQILIIFLTIILFDRCITEEKQITKNIKQLLPPVPPSFSASDSSKLITNWTIGIRFYKSNCANCHGIFGKGKDSVPDFSKKQMDTYKSAFLAGDTLNHAVMAKMTEDELNDVLLFLTDIKH